MENWVKVFVQARLIASKGWAVLYFTKTKQKCVKVYTILLIYKKLPITTNQNKNDFSYKYKF